MFTEQLRDLSLISSTFINFFLLECNPVFVSKRILFNFPIIPLFSSFLKCFFRNNAVIIL